MTYCCFDGDILIDHNVVSCSASQSRWCGSVTHKGTLGELDGTGDIMPAVSMLRSVQLNGLNVTVMNVGDDAQLEAVVKCFQTTETVIKAVLDSDMSVGTWISHGACDANLLHVVLTNRGMTSRAFYSVVFSE